MLDYHNLGDKHQEHQKLFIYYILFLFNMLQPSFQFIKARDNSYQLFEIFSSLTIERGLFELNS